MKIVTASIEHPRDIRRNPEDTIIVELIEEWYHTAVHVGDPFHIIDCQDFELSNTTELEEVELPCANTTRKGLFKSYNPLVLQVNNTHGVLIVFPDIYISPTKVAESCSCLRRSVLSERFKSFGMSSTVAVLGKLRHSFIERFTDRSLARVNIIGDDHLKLTEASLLQYWTNSPNLVQELIEESVRENMEELYAIKISDEEIKRDLQSLLQPIVKWIVVAVREGFLALAQQQSVDVHATQSSLARVSSCWMQGLSGIEETIQSSLLGIKGQVDMIAGGKLLHIPPGTGVDSSIADSLVPLEVKTGRWKVSTAIAHRAQIILYILLLNIRRRSLSNLLFSDGVPQNKTMESQFGLLLYIGDNEAKVDFVKPSWTDFRALLLSRNNLAARIHQSIAPTTADQPNASSNKLPPLIKSEFDCKYCYNASECLAMHAAIEDGTADSSGIPQQFQYVLKGISARHLQYLKHWDSLIDLELIATESNARNLWSQSGISREMSGQKCLSSLELDAAAMVSKDANTMEIKLKRCSDSAGGMKWISLLQELNKMQVMAGDRMLISLEKVSASASVGVTPSGSSRSSAGTPVEPMIQAINSNICSGTIQEIQADYICIAVNHGARAIRE